MSDDKFLYPPKGQKLRYNFLDTVHAEWSTGYGESQLCSLELFWWTAQTNTWKNSYNKTVPCSGAQNVNLNIDINRGFLGQFNLKFPDTDDRILSSIMDIDHNPSAKPKFWKKKDVAMTTETSAAAATLSTVYATVTSQPTQSSIAQSPQPEISAAAAAAPASASASRLAPNAMIGIAIGVVLGVSILAAIAILLWRRRSKRHKDLANADSVSELGSSQSGGRPLHERSEVAWPPPTYSSSSSTVAVTEEKRMAELECCGARMELAARERARESTTVRTFYHEKG